MNRNQHSDCLDHFGSQRRELMTGSLACALLTLSTNAKTENSGLAADNPADVTVSSVRISQLIEALRLAGDPLPEGEASQLLAMTERMTDIPGDEIARIIDRHTLIDVRLNPSGIGTARLSGAIPKLRELGWRSFLVRVHNPSRLTGPLMLFSRCAMPEGDVQNGNHEGHILGNDVPEITLTGRDVKADKGPDAAQWLGFQFGVGPLLGRLEGERLEYQLLQLYSLLSGSNEAPIGISLAVRRSSTASYIESFVASFSCESAKETMLDIRDSDGRGTTASLLILDGTERLYPGPAHRLEPDLSYQPQIYRADGETVRLPAGRYRVIARRGPEYLACIRDWVVAAEGASAKLRIDLERWVDPTRFGWYPGDPHLHPEGQHYGIVSKYGLTPETMLRQVQGEGLSVGAILIWAGGYYYEKQFLTGHVYEPSYVLPFSDAQHANHSTLTPRRTPHAGDSLIRYDVEQAAFPSNRLGHLILLLLKNHDFPGARGVYDWPSWNLPIAQWARAQGALVGYAHIGFNMNGISTALPNFDIPPMDDLGANECLVDITHGLVDFVAGGENPPFTELNCWYHLLNCGFRLPMIGETDFWSHNACVGATRTYVRLDRNPVGDAGYAAWVRGIKACRLYFGDGRTHFIDFCANETIRDGEELRLPHPGRIRLSASIAARLEPEPFEIEAELLRQHLFSYWHIERARVGSSRNVPLEVIVNGHVVERREILADGKLRDFSFAVEIERSSWVALRILPSAHTAPLFVFVGWRPLRASKRSAQWCLDCLEVLWTNHAMRIRETERLQAAAAWDHAREVYSRIKSECAID